MIQHRPRRLRQSATMRRLVAETRLHPAELIQPLFVSESLVQPRPIQSMPGIYQQTEASIHTEVAAAVDAGVGAVMLFGIPAMRDERGSVADLPTGILNRTVRALREGFGDRIVLITDLCLDEFTTHGHCGLLDARGNVDNDATLERYREVAVSQAEAGAHVLGLSGMMDGQVAACREALDEAGFTDVALAAYSAKYASTFYGPFREAVQSELNGDRRQYQQDAANARESMREIELDVAEAADFIIIKPAMLNGDVLAQAAATLHIPVWGYQVSGEYAMVECAAAAGAFERFQAILESLTALKRAGSRSVITYWATEVARYLRDPETKD